jgi:hypothetical protein
MSTIVLPILLQATTITYWPSSHQPTKSLSAGASNFVMLDVMKIGGITGWLRAFNQAEIAGFPVSSHLFPELSAQLLQFHGRGIGWNTGIRRHPS